MIKIVAAIVALAIAPFQIPTSNSEVHSCVTRAIQQGLSEVEARVNCHSASSSPSKQQPDPNNVAYPREYVVTKPMCSSVNVAACGTDVGTCPPGQTMVTEERYRRETATAPPVRIGLGRTYCADVNTESLPALVAEEFVRLKPQIATPSIQPPDGRTLVNFKTVFSTGTGAQEATRSLLGFNIVLRAVPINYHWEFGDGTSLDTDKPGRPYPAMDITHSYKETGTARVSVTVTFRGEFTVNGGPPQPIDGTISNRSSEVELTVVEARAELVAPPD